MKLLQLESNLRASPAAEIAEIAEFRDLIRRDRGSPGDSQGRNKQRAARELAFIFHCNSHESPYAAFDPDLRREKVQKDLFPEEWNWKEDDVLKAAEEKYQELSKTSLIRLLDAAEVAINRLTGYFRSVRFTPDPDEGDDESMVDVAKDVIANLKGLKDVVSSFRSLREEVEKEQAEGPRIKGGVRLNKYNR